MKYKVGDLVSWHTYKDKFGYVEEGGVGRIVEVDPEDDRLTYRVDIAGSTDSRWLIAEKLLKKEQKSDDG